MYWHTVSSESILGRPEFTLLSNVLLQYRADTAERSATMAAPGRRLPSVSGIVQSSAPGTTASDVKPIEELLRERIRLDERLQQAFRRDITLLFSDMHNATASFERHGDRDSQPMVQHHNDLLLPLISNHQGTVLQTVRDTIMASFAEPPAAVQAAIAMQRALRQHNRGREMAQQMRVRIGIN